MIGCLVLAFALCQPGGYGYAQAYSGAYAQSGYYVQQPQVVYAQPQVYYQPQPVYVVQPVYAQPYPVAQPYYGGGYNNYPFGGINVRVGPRGGVAVGVGR